MYWRGHFPFAADLFKVIRVPPSNVAIALLHLSARLSENPSSGKQFLFPLEKDKLAIEYLEIGRISGQGPSVNTKNWRLDQSFES